MCQKNQADYTAVKKAQLHSMVPRSVPGNISDRSNEPAPIMVTSHCASTRSPCKCRTSKPNTPTKM